MTTTIHELRDPAEARRYLLQGLWLQRVQAPPLHSLVILSLPQKVPVLFNLFAALAWFLTQGGVGFYLN